MRSETVEERLERECNESQAVTEDRGRMLVRLAHHYHVCKHPSSPRFWKCPRWPCADVQGIDI